MRKISPQLDSIPRPNYGVLLRKVHLVNCRERTEEEKRYSSTLSSTSPIDEGGCWTPHPSRFTSGKVTQYPLYRRLGRTQGRSGRVMKNSPTRGFDPRSVQPVASRYTDWVILVLSSQYDIYRYTSLFANYYHKLNVEDLKVNNMKNASYFMWHRMNW